MRKIINCALPKIPVPLGCDEAADRADQTKMGWYYCEKKGENFDDACKDGVDNDDDNANGTIGDLGDSVDCADPDCNDCGVCGGSDMACGRGCRYGVEITEAARNETVGQFVSIKCNPQPTGQTCQ